MDQPIMLTPVQIWTAILGIAVAITSLSAAASAISKMIEKMRTPERGQDKKIAEHEKILNEHEEQLKAVAEFLHSDKKRLDSAEEGNKVTQQALLALLSHALDADNADQLRNAKNDLEYYLINR